MGISSDKFMWHSLTSVKPVTGYPRLRAELEDLAIRRGVNDDERDLFAKSDEIG